jgi:translocation and assembly module TamA
MRALALFSVAATLFSCAHSEQQLCENIFLKQGRLNLSTNEKVLVCGSPKGGEGWRHVPLPQAQYHLKVLLQEQGHLNPRFERKGNQLNVWSGAKAQFNQLKVVGAEGILTADKKRNIIGENITSAKLDEISQWAESELKSQGYACPQVDVKVQAWDGLAYVSVAPGLRAKVAKIRRTGLDDLDEQTLARYMAFAVGEVYDVRKTQLSVARLLTDGLIQSAYFTVACEGDRADLHLRADIGRPRLFRIGLGASTEEFPFVDFWFKNTKIDDRASSLTATLHASPLLQSLDLSTELYWLPSAFRTFFGPRFRAARKSESFLEELSIKVGADLGRNWDVWSTRLRSRLGPTLNYVNTVRGQGPDDVSFVSWEGSILAMSHVYEFGARDQFSGWEARFDYDGQRADGGSYINVDKYEVNIKRLWNLGNFAPPLFVLGTRIDLAAVDNRNKVAKLPSEYRYFYGGDENLRGFGRKVLNNGDFGYLTAAYMGFELRLIEELPYRLEPFLLYDIAKLGDGRYNLSDPVFTSWGVGLRWASPFGTLRGSAARGEIFNEDQISDSYPQEWVYFFSFGQEF